MVSPDPPIGHRGLQQKKSRRIQDDHGGQDRQRGLSPIPIPEFVPDMEDGKRCEDEESREEDEGITRVLHREEHGNVEHHGRQDPEREKKHFFSLHRFEPAPSRYRIDSDREREKASAESKNNVLNQLQGKPDGVNPLTLEQGMSPGMEHPQLPKYTAVRFPPAAHPYHRNEPGQAGGRQYANGSDDSSGCHVPYGIQPHREKKNRGALPDPPRQPKNDSRDPQILLLPRQDPPAEEGDGRAEKCFDDVGKGDFSVKPERRAE